MIHMYLDSVNNLRFGGIEYVMFHPEPNYGLALTGGLGYSLLASGLYLHNYISISTGFLALTSIWFHTRRSTVSFWLDQAAIVVWSGTMLYDSYRAGWSEFGAGVGCLGYSVFVFYYGHRTGKYAYHPNRIVSTLFHASIHVLSILVAFWNLALFSRHDSGFLAEG